MVEKVRQPVDKEALVQRLKEMNPNAQAEGILATIGYVERMVAKGKDRSFFERMLSESEKGGDVDQIRGAKITLDCYKLIAKAPEKPKEAPAEEKPAVVKAPEPEKPAVAEKPKEAPKEEKPAIVKAPDVEKPREPPKEVEKPKEAPKELSNKEWIDEIYTMRNYNRAIPALLGRVSDAKAEWTASDTTALLKELGREGGQPSLTSSYLEHINAIRKKHPDAWNPAQHDPLLDEISASSRKYASETSDPGMGSYAAKNAVDFAELRTTAEAKPKEAPKEPQKEEKPKEAEKPVVKAPEKPAEAQKEEKPAAVKPPEEEKARSKEVRELFEQFAKDTLNGKKKEPPKEEKPVVVKPEVALGQDEETKKFLSKVLTSFLGQYTPEGIENVRVSLVESILKSDRPVKVKEFMIMKIDEGAAVRKRAMEHLKRIP